jgi:hypothetical protein
MKLTHVTHKFLFKDGGTCRVVFQVKKPEYLMRTFDFRKKK